MIFSLVYVSSATTPWSRADLENLLAQCRERNAEAGVTGMLLYRDGRIIQLLEGEEDTVRGLYARIEHDPRHEDVVNVWSGHDENGRSFPEWTMGFREVDDEPVDLPGYTDFLSRSITATELTHTTNLGQELLQMFRKFR